MMEEVTTIFVVGFPHDLREREFQNIFFFCPGFLGASLKVPGLESTDPAHRQSIGFARFGTRTQALAACHFITGRIIDREKGCHLKAEMAKKNLFIKELGATNVPLTPAAAAANRTNGHHNHNSGNGNSIEQRLQRAGEYAAAAAVSPLTPQLSPMSVITDEGDARHRPSHSVHPDGQANDGYWRSISDDVYGKASTQVLALAHASDDQYTEQEKEAKRMTYLASPMSLASHQSPQAVNEHVMTSSSDVFWPDDTTDSDASAQTAPVMTRYKPSNDTPNRFQSRNGDAAMKEKTSTGAHQQHLRSYSMTSLRNVPRSSALFTSPEFKAIHTDRKPSRSATAGLHLEGINEVPSPERFQAPVQAKAAGIQHLFDGNGTESSDDFVRSSVSSSRISLRSFSQYSQYSQQEEELTDAGWMPKSARVPHHALQQPRAASKTDIDRFYQDANREFENLRIDDFTP